MRAASRSVLVFLICLAFPACGYLLQSSRSERAELGPGWPPARPAFRETRRPALHADLPLPENAAYVRRDQRCLGCHRGYQDGFLHGVHRELGPEEGCESCHGPASEHLRTRGKQPGSILSFAAMNAVQRSEVCARCHQEGTCDSLSNWRTAPHLHAGVGCTDCHRIHDVLETTGPGEAAKRGADRPAADHAARPPTDGQAGAGSCYRCHQAMAALGQLAGPHRIGGTDGFRCTDCHDPHGRVLAPARTDLCLECHSSGSPTMAWHSSLHAIAGVACTDCHQPHPRPAARRARDITHATVVRPQRLAMSVQQPQTCYGCHPRVFAESSLPSRHPVAEGKMLCSDCHDAHGAAHRGLREPTLNQVCYRCHSELQGPFAYDHPPVTEDCAICHVAHGSVNDHLLRQPTTFLCLRCHSGHRSDHRQLDSSSAMQRALYTDCTHCHQQIHGSDLINETLRGRGLSR